MVILKTEIKIFAMQTGGDDCMRPPMKIFVLFECYLDGDGYNTFNQWSVHRTEDDARSKATERVQSVSGKGSGKGYYHTPLHSSMNEANNYTVVSTREAIGTLSEMPADARGFLIEIQTL